jgi:hypothetical protein
LRHFFKRGEYDHKIMEILDHCIWKGKHYLLHVLWQDDFKVWAPAKMYMNDEPELVHAHVLEKDLKGGDWDVIRMVKSQADIQQMKEDHERKVKEEKAKRRKRLKEECARNAVAVHQKRLVSEICFGNVGDKW